MASATMNDVINDVTIPSTSEGKQTFLQLLSDSIISANDASAHSSTLPPTTVNLSSVVTNPDADTLTAPNKTMPKKKNPNAMKEVHGSRATAKSLCAIDWVASNVGGTNAMFENYWRKLDKDEKKKYQDKLVLLRTARACAVASPSFTGSEVERTADGTMLLPL